MHPYVAPRINVGGEGVHGCPVHSGSDGCRASYGGGGGRGTQFPTTD